MKSTSSQWQNSLLGIGQLSRETGLPASTIRYWERIGVLPRPMRVSGQRRYQAESRWRLAVLRLAKECGFTLQEMRELARGFGADAVPMLRWREMAGRKLIEIDERLARLGAMRALIERVAQCQCPDWSECGRLAVAGAGKRPGSSK